MIPGLFAHLWQSTLFAAGAWLAALWLRANRAHVRYWVWFMASVKFLIPFSLLVGLGTLTPHHAAGTRPEQNGWPRCRN
jgi:bla regulator protein BlaR1